jgi:hypothetical protein
MFSDERPKSSSAIIPFIRWNKKFPRVQYKRTRRSGKKRMFKRPEG